MYLRALDAWPYKSFGAEREGKEEWKWETHRVAQPLSSGVPGTAPDTCRLGCLACGGRALLCSTRPKAALHIKLKAVVPRKTPRLTFTNPTFRKIESPHKVEEVNAAQRSIRLSGVDLVDGTPVLDVKPYVPDYDCPRKRDTHGHGPGGSAVEDGVRVAVSSGSPVGANRAGTRAFGGGGGGAVGRAC